MMTNHITTFRKASKIDKTLNLSEATPLIEAISLTLFRACTYTSKNNGEKRWISRSIYSC